MPSTLSNREIAAVFHAIADSMEILNEDRFRLQAYRRAAEVIQDLPAPLATYRERGELHSLPGVGKAITDKVGELLDTGQLQFYEKLRARVPTGLLDLLRIPNLGPRSVARLHEELGISSIADLKAAIDQGQVAKLKGFGAKTVDGILQGIQSLEQHPPLRRLMFDALRTVEQLITLLKATTSTIHEITYAGSLRRARPTVGDLDLLVATDNPVAVIQAFVALPLVARVEAAGDQKASVILHNGFQADLLALAPTMWGSALQHFTGSKEHNIRFRERARDLGLSFSEHGFQRADGSLLTCATEAEVYATLGLPWIPPELREGAGEFEAALNGTLPHLVQLDQLRADLHMHSTWSDGKGSIRDMADQARARGYAYIAITDHSAYLGITNGLDAERLRLQAREIAALNAEFQANGDPFRILRGIEVDITPEGGLALPDDVLAELDLVVASPHVSLRQPAPQATERLVRAMRNPHVDILGHPTGRLINQRDGSDIDLEVIGRVAAETRTLLEVNSGPDRLDLDSSMVRRVLELGAKLSINSDSHHPDNLPWIRLGVMTARRGWATEADVANTWSLDQLLTWVQH
jgi:DNA polymerase (family 10)